ncbi:MAG TPA: aquaporin [Deltaproteobacteria bacterium]|nr:aquaporin [Deltaproteobacteria bacterium]
MKSYFAEFIGTFTLVFVGCGTAVIAGKDVGFLGIAFAFGLALLAMCYGIGPVSGCHVNPAVSLGVFAAGRMSVADLFGYIISQCLGALVAAWLLREVVMGRISAYDVTASGLGQNGWGPGLFGGYSQNSAMIFETVATFLFLVVILGSTETGAPTAIAGVAIGLTLAVIHILGIPITGVSVNPARSLGPAVLVGGKAMQQLWLFLVFPPLGAIAAGVLYRLRALGKASGA